MIETQGGRPLAVEKLEKHFMDRGKVVKAVDDVSFEVKEGAFYTLLGPSGCGKTTTLRCVAGLEQTEGGRITVDGKVVSDNNARTFVPPHKRDIGMVFQSYGIWPHMTVFENAAFPLRVTKKSGLSKAQIKQRVEESLATVQLGGYEGRMATQLSGGQQQRLSLARALVRQPKLLLLDEPLSNLDAKLREAMRAEVSGLQRRLGITTLYVTHDQSEALSMSSRIAVMSDGRIAQEGNPREIYQRPVTRFVADFVGTTNFIEATVLGPDQTGYRLQTDMGQVSAICPADTKNDEQVLLGIRPENLRVHQTEPHGLANVLPGVVEQVMFLGESIDLYIRVGARVLISRQGSHLQVKPTDDVWVELPVDLCAVITEHGVASRHMGRPEPGSDEELIERAQGGVTVADSLLVPDEPEKASDGAEKASGEPEKASEEA